MSTTFGDLLRTHRVRSALTQEELAAGSGVSVRAISDMERGRAKGPQRRTVEALARVLGLDGAELRELVDTAKAGRMRHQAPAAPWALPPDVPDLTGRAAELRRLEQVAGGGRATEVVVVHGPPGAGKTTLVVHAAYRLAERFPDGCLFVNLRGMDARPVPPGEVMHKVLRTLGIPEERIPAVEEERASLYRAELRGRSTALVLDNAADEAQVRPLLATGSSSLVLVTSRQTLGGLEVGARLALDVLSGAESVWLLGAIAGVERIYAEQADAERVAELCGRLPLALRIAGNRLASRPRWTVAHLAEQLGDEGRRLSALTSGDLRVRAAFLMSYQHLNERAALVFRRMSLAPGGDVTPSLVAVAAGIAEDAAEETLEELVDASLVEVSATAGRYVCHDLLRVFARERLAADESPAVLDEARWRTIDWLLREARSSARVFGPNGADGDRDHAATWLQRETGHWIGALRLAHAARRHRTVLDVATAMHWYSDQRGDGLLWHEVFRYGVDAARALGSRRDEAVQLNFVCWTLCVLLDQQDAALVVHEQAWAAAVDCGDLAEQAWALYYRSAIERRQGRLDEASAFAVRAVEGFEAAGDELSVQFALSNLGILLHLFGRYAESAEVHRKCVAFHRARVEDRPHDRETLAVNLLRLAANLIALRDWDSAREACEEALELARSTQARNSESDALFRLGAVLHGQGDGAGAVARLREAVEVVNPMRTTALVEMLGLLATVHDGLGETDQARSYRLRALDICTRSGTAATRAMSEDLRRALDAPAEVRTDGHA
ncbi:tetratricopeptide repeat protein [Umezawaea endophytica]|uniref:Tetratricopeptide repeat protein n=1 Tax=Umezawaea endophytica TaxID=1654476 RepID=A0A9X2VWT1_9PSEU|nr:XRE family transcriptional regulator [Umezawaea endophytica]MCS7484046.1 tetratricopeptide repeat protein [Umezawaea endophytica]